MTKAQFDSITAMSNGVYPGEGEIILQDYPVEEIHETEYSNGSKRYHIDVEYKGSSKPVQLKTGVAPNKESYTIANFKASRSTVNIDGRDIEVLPVKTFAL